MQERAVVRTASRLIEKIAIDWCKWGYYYWVAERIPDGKASRAVDERLAQKYGLRRSKWQLYKDSRQGQAKVKYARHDHFFVLFATAGIHRFYLPTTDGGESVLDERGRERRIRDIRKKDGVFCYEGYAVRVTHTPRTKSGYTVSVRIERNEYEALRDYFTTLACRKSVHGLMSEFRSIGVEPYRGVRRQLFLILGYVNRKRSRAGLTPIPDSCIPWRIRRSR